MGGLASRTTPDEPRVTSRWIVVCWAASLCYVATVAWKEGRGKTHDEAALTHQARNDLRARMEVDSLILERTKAADDSTIVELSEELAHLETRCENVRLTSQ